MGLLKRHGDWLTAEVGGELVMMSVERGKYLGLNDIGNRIWSLLEEPRSMDDVCAQLVDEFDVSAEVCRKEVEAFIADLTTHKAVVEA